MRSLLGLILMIPLTVGCMLKTSDDEEEEEEEEEDWGELTGVWELRWDSAGATHESSCSMDINSYAYFSEPILRIHIDLLSNNSLVVDVGELPQEYPCDLGESTMYFGTCLDENPSSTRMDGRLSTDTSFTADTTYGFSNGSEYGEWQFEMSGNITSGQLSGDADMKLTAGNETTECRIQIKQSFVGQAL
jgi:hypothetical protein